MIEVMKRMKTFIKIILVCSLIFLFILTLLSMNGIYIQLGIPSVGISHQFLNLLFIFTTVFSGVYLINYKQKDKALKGIVAAIGLFLLIIPLLNWIMSSDAEYITFTSPDKKEKFLIIETGHGELYQLSDSKLFMIHLADINTDDGFKPFTNKAFKLEWEEPNKLFIHYAFDYMEPDKYQKISITYKAH